MPHVKDVIQHIPGEDDEDYAAEDLLNIQAWGADLSFRELIFRYQEGTLLKPELQRRYVWDKPEASRFIDSLLLGIPIPSIFLAKTTAETMLIVDGYQRIMTVHDFVKGVFSGDNKTFALSRADKISPRWAGKTYAELSDTEQRRIVNTTIHAIVFAQEHPSGRNTGLYQVFERINTSGRTLLPQEIRNCIYQGTFNSLLFELNEYGSWRQLFGLPTPESRMRDMEFILRFFALSSEAFRNERKERISLKQFLNTFMGEHRNADEAEVQTLRARFIGAADVLSKHIGPHAFHNLSPTVEGKLIPKFSPTIFDSLMIAADRALGEGKRAPVADAEKARRALLRDDEYRRATSQETMRKETIALRVDKAYRALFGEPV